MKYWEFTDEYLINKKMYPLIPLQLFNLRKELKKAQSQNDIHKIKEMSSPELEKELGELKTELFKLKFSLATNTLDNPMKIRDVKKDIARINTVLTERKIAEKKGVNE